MATVTLRATVREQVGTGHNRRLRRKGKLPGVLYGAHLDQNVLLELEVADVRKFFSHPEEERGVLTLRVQGAKEDSEREAIIKEVQYDWLKDEIRHIDFYELTRGEAVTIMVPLHLVGTDTVAKRGAVVEQNLRELEAECLPKDIPAGLEISIEGLRIGDFLTVKDVAVPEGVRVITGENERVVSVMAPTREKAVEEAVPEAEAAEVEVVGEAESEEPSEGA